VRARGCRDARGERWIRTPRNDRQQVGTPSRQRAGLPAGPRFV